MAPRSEDSSINYERLNARIQYASRESSPKDPARGNADSWLAGVGDLFGGQITDRRESNPPPLIVSESEDAVRQPRSALQPESSLEASPNEGERFSLGSPPTTPIPSRNQLLPWIQTTDLPQARRRIEKKKRRQRTRSSRRRTHTSRNASETEPSPTNTTMDYSNENEEREQRGRSITPTPYLPPSLTPSQRSEETNEEHRELREPESPHPFNEWDRYNSSHSREAIVRFEEQVRGESATAGGLSNPRRSSRFRDEPPQEQPGC